MRPSGYAPSTLMTPRPAAAQSMAPPPPWLRRLRPAGWVVVVVVVARALRRRRSALWVFRWGQTAGGWPFPSLPFPARPGPARGHTEHLAHSSRQQSLPACVCGSWMGTSGGGVGAGLALFMQWHVHQSHWLTPSVRPLLPHGPPGNAHDAGAGRCRHRADVPHVGLHRHLNVALPRVSGLHGVACTRMLGGLAPARARACARASRRAAGGGATTWGCRNHGVEGMRDDTPSVGLRRTSGSVAGACLVLPVPVPVALAMSSGADRWPPFRGGPAGTPAPASPSPCSTATRVACTVSPRAWTSGQSPCPYPTATASLAGSAMARWVQPQPPPQLQVTGWQAAAAAAAAAHAVPIASCPIRFLRTLPAGWHARTPWRSGRAAARALGAHPCSMLLL